MNSIVEKEKQLHELEMQLFKKIRQQALQEALDAMPKLPKSVVHYQSMTVCHEAEEYADEIRDNITKLMEEKGK